MKLGWRWILINLALTLTMANAASIPNADALIRAMHDRYAKSWYKTLTFTQKSTTYNADGTSKADTWYEAAMLPGKLRIDIGSPSAGNAFILSDGTLTVFQQGTQKVTRPLINMLLVLGFDVYCQPPAATLGVIKGEKYDLTKFHEDTWDGQPVYVVGADKGDLNSRQFWVEKDRLLFVRLIEPSQADPNKMQDIRFMHYQRLAGGWLAPQVEVYADNKKVFSEEYSDIRANPPLDPATFDPKKFSSAPHH